MALAPRFEELRAVEVPVYGPMDCDLLPSSEPSAPTATSGSTSPALLWSQHSNSRRRSRCSRSMTGYHRANRLGLLGQLLSALPELGLEAVAVRDAWPQLADSAAHSPFKAVSAT